MLHQVQAYKSPDQNVPNGIEGFEGAANCNAFLYCEMVENNPRPEEPVLVKSGNFATQPSTPTSNDQIDGTLVIGSHIFLGRFLLPRLQGLCQASEIFHLRGVVTDDLVASAPFLPGYDPSHPKSTDPIYAFVNQNPKNEPSIPNVFRFSKVNAPEDMIKDDGKTLCRVRVKGVFSLGLLT